MEQQKKKRDRTGEYKKRIPKQLENPEMYWQIPSITTSDGFVHNFSNYKVNSETGKIWSIKRGKHLKPCLNGEPGIGYLATSITSDDGFVLASYEHRICLAAKIGHWDWESCHHIDHDRQNNKPSNLEACMERRFHFNDITRKAQSDAKLGSLHPRSKLNEEQVREIKRGALTATKMSHYKKEMASTYKVSYENVSCILNGKTWNHVQLEYSV